MRYYLVALFDEESNKAIEPLQRSMSKKYKLYRNLPTLHITLDIIDDPDLNKLDEVLNKIIKPYKRFKVELSEVRHYEQPYKSVNLRVTSKGYIKRLARSINDTLRLHGFNVRQSSDKWDLFVPLTCTNYSSKDFNKNESFKAGTIAKQDGYNAMAKISRIELWKPVNNKKETIVKSYSLRSF